MSRLAVVVGVACLVLAAGTVAYYVAGPPLPPATSTVALPPPTDDEEGEPEHVQVLEVADADTFAGTARAASKTSIASAPIEEFADLPALVATLPSDDAMRHHEPRISEERTSARVAEEKRNVRVHAYLWAGKREDDHDFHLMLGTKAGDVFLTAEVSGLPASGPFRAPLSTARSGFLAIVAGHVPGATHYERFTPARAVVVTGSLFYDIDHAPGAVGPTWAKPRTAWEIHPVTEIHGE